MIVSTAKGMKRVDKVTFDWFMKSIETTPVNGVNGQNFYDKRGEIVAQILNGNYYVKP